RPAMGAADRLAQLLRAALRAEEPREVEELLRRGADPNLVLPDGAAAMHLRCLEALLRRGGDPNVRSSEGLTPLHVAAAWGCLRGVELLLSQGADPVLRDQDGLRALDLAEQQGHRDCARVLGKLGMRTRIRAPTLEQEPDPEPGGDGRDLGLEAAPGQPNLPEPQEAANQNHSLEAPLGLWDYSSEASFVTAVEASGAEDSAPDSPPWARSLPHTMQGLLPGVWPPQRVPRSLSASPLAHRAIMGNRDPVPTCWHPPVPAVSDLELLWQLRVHGESPGPITPFTRPYYLQRLEEAKAGPGHSPELAEALRTGRIPDAQAEEDALAQQFEQPDPARRWREGIVKSSFTYLLLDPRETQDLPGRAFLLTPAERLQTFVRAIFYVGKGTRARPDAHLWEAIGQRGRPGKQACAKVRRILDIWASDRGVISLHCFQHVVAAEAYTREACLVDALGIQTLTNQKQGHCYGVVASWPPARRRRLGVHLLHRALLVFLAEGERELRPQDIQARG
uniref:Ankyrin repeat and LEM domain containing 1 n=1 Tax=Loxodonta africana TaxID=9785 RepID=G3T915_LOXAF